MISAPTGSMPKVIGSSIAMVAIGPTPGSTPISVPTRQPDEAQAIASPNWRMVSENTTTAPSTQSGPRRVQRSRPGPGVVKAETAMMTPRPPTSTASAWGSMPGPIARKDPVASADACHSAKSPMATKKSPAPSS
jgi:hypothetical protein